MENTSLNIITVNYRENKIMKSWKHLFHNRSNKFHIKNINENEKNRKIKIPKYNYIW